MGQNLWYHIWVDEHPFTIYFDVHQGTTVLTHGHLLSAGQFQLISPHHLHHAPFMVFLARDPTKPWTKYLLVCLGRRNGFLHFFPGKVASLEMDEIHQILRGVILDALDALDLDRGILPNAT